MKLTDKSKQVLKYLIENGGKMTLDKLCSDLDRKKVSISANVTDLTKKGLVIREKVDKDVFVILTEAGEELRGELD